MAPLWPCALSNSFREAYFHQHMACREVKICLPISPTVTAVKLTKGRCAASLNSWSLLLANNLFSYIFFRSLVPGVPHPVGVPGASCRGAAIGPAQRGRRLRSCHHGDGREASGVAWQPGLGARGASGEFGAGGGEGAGGRLENGPEAAQTEGGRMGWGRRGATGVHRKVLGVRTALAGRHRDGGSAAHACRLFCTSVACSPHRSTGEHSQGEPRSVWWRERTLTECSRPNFGFLSAERDQKEVIERIALMQRSCFLKSCHRGSTFIFSVGLVMPIGKPQLKQNEFMETWQDLHFASQQESSQVRDIQRKLMETTRCLYNDSYFSSGFWTRCYKNLQLACANQKARTQSIELQG